MAECTFTLPNGDSMGIEFPDDAGEDTQRLAVQLLCRNVMAKHGTGDPEMDIISFAKGIYGPARKPKPPRNPRARGPYKTRDKRSQESSI